MTNCDMLRRVCFYLGDRALEYLLPSQNIANLGNIGPPGTLFGYHFDVWIVSAAHCHLGYSPVIVIRMVILPVVCSSRMCGFLPSPCSDGQKPGW